MKKPKSVGLTTRMLAARVLSIAASNPGLNSYDAAKRLGLHSRRRAAWLARRALSHVSLWLYPRTQAELYAHAESLVRTGF